MPQQNFENDNIKTRIVDGRQEIFDCLRGKYVAMTPEENVRQMFVLLRINMANVYCSILLVSLRMLISLKQGKKGMKTNPSKRL